MLRFLTILFFGVQLWALPLPPEVRIELGETLPLTRPFAKIWVEDRKILTVENKAGFYRLKAAGTGLTHYRLDNRLYTARVLPLGAKNNFSSWVKLTPQFVDVNVSYCGPRVCLTGTLYSLNELVRLQKLLHSRPASLALNTDEELQAQVQQHFDKQMRADGLTPLKIIFSEPWQVRVPRTKKIPELEKYGLLALATDDSTEILNNVKVSVQIVELSKNFDRKLGVRWADGVQAQLVGGSRLGGPAALDLTLSAAEKSGEARILASPELVCRSGKEAQFFAGGEFPIRSIRLHSQETIWKKYGIQLKLKPLIDATGQMSLQVETEVSTLDRSITVDDTPALHTNRVSSHFDLIESKTIAISGLVKNESSRSTEGVPFLKDIPILGALFASKNFQENKTELIIFVTPELMR